MIQIKPKIYVACLAAYNNGYLHGAWIDAQNDIDSLHVEIQSMLLGSPVSNAEEWAIHDYEGFGGLSISECVGLEVVIAIADFIAEYGELGSAVLAYMNCDIDNSRRLLDDCYHGEYNSEEDFAYQLAEYTMTISLYLSYYIDYEKMARDLFINDYFSIEANHKIHVFNYY